MRESRESRAEKQQHEEREGVAGEKQALCQNCCTRPCHSVVAALAGFCCRCCCCFGPSSDDVFSSSRQRRNECSPLPSHLLQNLIQENEKNPDQSAPDFTPILFDDDDGFFLLPATACSYSHHMPNAVPLSAFCLSR